MEGSLYGFNRKVGSELVGATVFGSFINLQNPGLKVSGSVLKFCFFRQLIYFFKSAGSGQVVHLEIRGNVYKPEDGFLAC